MRDGAIDQVVRLMARLPGMGQRSARRAILHMLERKEVLMMPLAAALVEAAERIGPCRICGNLDMTDPCDICTDPRRDAGTICVVEHVSDLWAMERTRAFGGHYHVLGGVLSALDGVGPDNLNLARLISRVREGDIKEIVLALSATVDGQTTAHYLTAELAAFGVTVSRLAHGVPVGGELGHLDADTLTTALNARRPAV